MAHFAELDETNKVLKVIVVDNKDILDEDGNESEAKGISFCQELFGGKWIQTSYNASFRGNFACINGTYDSINDIFTLPNKPLGSDLEPNAGVTNEQSN